MRRGLHRIVKESVDGLARSPGGALGIASMYRRRGVVVYGSAAAKRSLIFVFVPPNFVLQKKLLVWPSLPAVLAVVVWNRIPEEYESTR